MENVKEGVFVNQPPILDGMNYDYWKAPMVSFLKFMDTRTYKANINGWTPQKVTNENNTEIFKQ